MISIQRGVFSAVMLSASLVFAALLFAMGAPGTCAGSLRAGFHADADQQPLVLGDEEDQRQAQAQDKDQKEDKKDDKKDEKKGLPLKPDHKITFTTDEGTWLSLDVSPDGKTIVFELMGDLYTLPIEGGQAN